MDDSGTTGETLTEASAPDTGQLLSLKSGDAFMVCDAWGDLRGGAGGLFSGDTRILSDYEMLIGERRPSRLSFGLSRDNATFAFHGANLALPPVGGKSTPRGVIHIERRRCLHGERMYERVRLTNFGLEQTWAPIAFRLGADFRDMFEVRGAVRLQRGEVLAPVLEGREVRFGYRGLDEVRREGVVAFSEAPGRLRPDRVDFLLPLAPDHPIDLYIEAGPAGGETPSAVRFAAAEAAAHAQVRGLDLTGGRIEASDGGFQAWLTQSRLDVAALTTRLETGPYPYAGIPWFSTPFGRDGIICAWQMLWLDPSLARGVLAYLAQRQAAETSAFADAQPGKIMHETRRGEMAALGEVPFGLYYGGVDTTPLFIALAGAYLRRTDDVALLTQIYPALQRAAGWLDEYGDSDGDGFIDYERAEASGLSNQGWKDSVDSVFHADAALARGPIALVEVQGYAFAAWRALGEIERRLGLGDGVEWAARAEAMRAAVEDQFWMQDRGGYALARDGEGRLCEVLASNPGHLLFVGLPSAERAAKVSATLLSSRFDAGWGLRTVAAGEARFNPMSYHNGSIWPHDTAIALAGMGRYGERAGVAKVMMDLFEASRHFDMRMPELLCGFARASHEPPIAYPVACMPQAWAAGSVFMMLQACLGLSIDAAAREVRLVRPRLPSGVDRLTLEKAPVGDGWVDLHFHRLGDRVGVTPGAASDGRVTVVLEG
ncbi:MAG TPA: glycogen debranching N-terminal domain-containing protein [Caulobacteraceae bacterium]|jgi:glycogen debranching enzyme|nr:glycogen debranching N-terminal domain-containing protein [Caulobacteraceae bacterium]